MDTKAPATTNFYPTFTVQHITNPNHFYAFPLLGFLVKVIMLIPQFIELMVLGIAAFFMVFVINPFVVLFTGTYWNPAYELYAGMLRLSTKIFLFMYGLTNKYPGFDFTISDTFSVEVVKPTKPNRWFAIPLLGGLARIILLIPFFIYESLIRYTAYLGMIGASFPVLFVGRYPESSYELARDSVRLNLSMSMYMSGLSDKYPSFWISMNHKTIKWILIILSVLYMLSSFGNGFKNGYYRSKQSQYNMQYRNRMMQNKMMQNYNSYPSDLKTGY